jgi:hypothetical protein
MDYLKYFVEKQRAGVVSLKKHVLYLLPPCEENFKIHPFGNNEILGVFVNIEDVSAKGRINYHSLYFKMAKE